MVAGSFADGSVWYGRIVEEPERGSPQTIAPGSHAGLLRVLAVALLARGALSIIGSGAFAYGDHFFLRLDGIGEADRSPLLGLTWGALALAAGLLLARRRRIGLVFAGAVCVAYLVVGVTVAFAAQPLLGLDRVGFWLVFAIDVVVPALVLAGLITLRPWFVALVGRRSEP